MSTIPIIVADEEETKPQSGILGGDTSPNKGVHLKQLTINPLNPLIRYNQEFFNTEYHRVPQSTTENK